MAAVRHPSSPDRTMGSWRLCAGWRLLVQRLRLLGLLLLLRHQLLELGLRLAKPRVCALVAPALLLVRPEAGSLPSAASSPDVVVEAARRRLPRDVDSWPTTMLMMPNLLRRLQQVARSRRSWE